jgi:hypothetical protein
MKKLVSLLFMLFFAQSVFAADPVKICVYDPSGASGDVYNLMKDYAIAAAEWGATVQLKPYTDEKIASEDFKAKQCAAVLMTGTRGRSLNLFSSSLEAMGAMPSYDIFKNVVSALLGEKGSKILNPEGSTEVAGVFPGGAIYLLVRDKSLNTVEALAGKRIATLDFDQASKFMVKYVKASIAAADVSTFAGMFNNGSVDAAYAPASAYKALELYKGVGKNGGVIRYPLAQLTLQLFIHTDLFPEGFGQKSRTFALAQFDKALSIAKKSEADIKNWIEIPEQDKVRYDQMFLDVRVGLRDNEKVYDGKALKLMAKSRCKANPSNAECAQQKE